MVVWHRDASHKFLVFSPQMISGEIHITFVNFWCLLNASFCVYVRFTDLTFIIASINAARDDQTFMNCRESRSLKRYFHLSGTNLYLCDCFLVLDYSNCCCLKPPNRMWPNVWSSSECLFIKKAESQVTGWLFDRHQSREVWEFRQTHFVSSED